MLAIGLCPIRFAAVPIRFANTARHAVCLCHKSLLGCDKELSLVVYPGERLCLLTDKSVRQSYES